MKKIFLFLTCFFASNIFCNKTELIKAIDALDINKVEITLSKIQVDQPLKSELLNYVDQIINTEKNKTKVWYKNYSALTSVTAGVPISFMGLRCVWRAVEEYLENPNVGYDFKEIKMAPIHILKGYPLKSELNVGLVIIMPVVIGASLLAGAGIKLCYSGLNLLISNKYKTARKIKELITTIRA